MSDPPRSLYLLRAAPAVGAPLPDGLVLRTVTDEDDGALGDLMERAYAGTIDEDLGGNSDGAVEIAEWRSGSAFSDVSVAVVDVKGALVSASLCSGTWDGDVWVSYVITDPAWKSQGLGAAAVAESVRRVRRRGDNDVLAGVTDGNTPSERMLATVGFVRVGPV